MRRLIKDVNVEIYQLVSKCVLGANDQMELSDQRRISFVENFSAIQLLPLIHKNTIPFVGMQSRDQYLICREKNGFFTALDLQGELHTWSIPTGNHLFEKPDEELGK